MTRLFAFVLALYLGAGSAYAQMQGFPDYVNAAPTISGPLLSTDNFPVIRGGVTFKISGTGIAGVITGPVSSTIGNIVSWGDTLGKTLLDSGISASGATGAGPLVLQNSPMLTTPTLGVATATTVNKYTLTTPATGATLTIANGKTLTISRTMQLTSPDDTTIATLPSGVHSLAPLDTPVFTGNVQIGGGLGIGGAPGGANRVDIFGSSSGSLSLRVPAASGSNVFTFPAGTTDFSANGGAHQVVKQSSFGGPLTVGQLATTDLSDIASFSLSTSGTIATSNTTASTNTTTGSGTFGGGVGIVGAANIGGAVSISSGTDATSPTAGGAFTVTGGAGIGGAIFVGGSGSYTLQTGALTLAGAPSAISLTGNGQAIVYGSANAGVAMLGRGISYDFAVLNKNQATVMVVPTGTQNLSLQGTTDATSQTAANLILGGGLAIGKSTWGGLANFTDTKSTTITNSASLPASMRFFSNEADGINEAYVWSCINSGPCSSTRTGNPYTVVSATINTPGSTTTNRILGAYGSYVIANSSGGGGSIGYISEITMTTDNTTVWGGNYLASDDATATTGTGAGRSLIGLELDLNYFKTSSVGYGLLIQGYSHSQPNGAVGMSVGHLDQNNPNDTIRWGDGLQMTDNCCTHALYVGSAGPSASGTSNSQDILFTAYSSGVGTQASISLTSNGLLTLNGAGIAIAGTEPFYIGGGGAAAPGNPPTGYVIYEDSADFHLKAKSSAGTVTSIANP